MLVTYQNCAPYSSEPTQNTNIAALTSTNTNNNENVEQNEPVNNAPPTLQVPKLTSDNRQEISWPYTFKWSLEGFTEGSKVDIWINDVDQGSAKNFIIGEWLIESGPIGEIKVELIEVLSDQSTKSLDIKTFVAKSNDETTDINNPPFLSLNIPKLASSTIDNRLWNQLTNDNHVFLTGDPKKLQVIKDDSDWWIRAAHLAGQVADLTQATSIPTAKTTNVSHTIKFAPNWTTGSGHLDSGKLGWGLAGGSTSRNIIVSGGSTENTGWSIRWGFDADYLAVYAYYANRPGMNYPNTPPSRLIGQIILTDVKIIPGNTYDLKMTVTTNDPGKANGSLRVSVDGVERINLTGMYYMSGTPETTRLFFASNHGGNASNLDWAPQEDTWVQYKDITVHR